MCVASCCIKASMKRDEKKEEKREKNSLWSCVATKLKPSSAQESATKAEKEAKQDGMWIILRAMILIVLQWSNADGVI